MTIMLENRLGPADYKIADVPMAPSASEYVSADTAAGVILAYFEPQSTSPHYDTTRHRDGHHWRIHGDTSLVVSDTGVVLWAGRREAPTDDPAEPQRGGRLAPSTSRRPAGNNGAKRGKGGHRHPTTVTELLERCEVAGLVVEETAKGNHWKITAAEGKRPATATSGVVFVSSTEHFRSIAKNTNKILRECGIDVRTVDPAQWRRQTRGSTGEVVGYPVSDSSPAPKSDSGDDAPPTTDPTTTEDPTVTAILDAPVSTEPEPTDPESGDQQPETDRAAVVARLRPLVHGKVKRATPEITADRLRFVAEMRRQGYLDSEIAEAMDWTPVLLAAFLSYQRRKGHPLAVPAKKQFLDPRTGRKTSPVGVINVDLTPKRKRQDAQPEPEGRHAAPEVEPVVVEPQSEPEPEPEPEVQPEPEVTPEPEPEVTPEPEPEPEPEEAPEEFPDDPARLAADPSATEADSAPQDGPGAPGAADPVGQAREADSEAHSPSWRARYDTVCVQCQAAIHRGAEIVRARGGWAHAHCPADLVAATLSPAEPVGSVVVPVGVPTVLGLLTAALTQAGVADPATVAQQVRVHLVLAGWDLTVTGRL